MYSEAVLSRKHAESRTLNCMNYFTVLISLAVQIEKLEEK
jgi:hypothetical protein